MFSFFLIFQSLYFILPAAFANMTPPLVKRLMILEYPMDFGKKWRGKRILGDHKTFRGLFFGIVAAVIIVLVQKILYEDVFFFRELSIVNYSSINVLLLGFLLGLGALIGDAVESFFKRRCSIAPGRSWFPWDQMDFIVGSLVFCMFIFIPPWEVIGLLIVLVPILHILINRVAYMLKLQKNKY